MFNPLVDMALVNRIMENGSTIDPAPNDTPKVSNNRKNDSKVDIDPSRCIGFNPYGGSSIVDREFLKDAKKHGVHVDKNGNYIIYKYGSYRRSVIIIGIIIIFLQLCILGNL